MLAALATSAAVAACAACAAVAADLACTILFCKKTLDKKIVKIRKRHEPDKRHWRRRPRQPAQLE